MTNKYSLDVCTQRIEELKSTRRIGEHCLIVAVGNKIDLPREVGREEAIASFEKCGVPASHYFETSAKTCEGVKEFLEGTLRLWYEANNDHLNDFIAEPRFVDISKEQLSLKMVFIGESSTGAKTSLVLRVVKNTFNEKGHPTIAAAFITHKLKVDLVQYKLDLWGLSSSMFLFCFISSLFSRFLVVVEQILLVKNGI